MKKILLLLCLVIALIACKNGTDEEIMQHQAVIMGKITAIDSIPIPEKLITYVYSDSKADYDEIEIKVAEDGAFLSTLTIEKPMSIAIYGDFGIQVIVSPGDSLSIVTNSRFNNTTYSGNGGEINTLIKKYKDTNPTENLMAGKDALSTQAYSAYLDSVLGVIKSFNADFLVKNDHPILKDYVASEESYFIAAKKLNYALFTAPQSEAPLSDEGFMESLNNLPLYKEAYEVNSNHPSTVVNYLGYTWENSVLKEGDEVRENAFLDGLMSLKNNAYLQKKILQSKVMNKLEDNNITFYENHKETIDKVFAGTTMETSVASKYDEVKQLLESPELPTDAELLTFNSEDPTKYIDEIIANANGKVVYIDNWATWCGPCKSEFKTASPELHEKFKDDIEFVYLCHNSKKAGYIPSIAKFQIAGKHYFLEDSESRPIFEQIDLRGFPTYTIINKRGEIVLSDHIHRPSYSKTAEILTELINEEI